eukprot:12060153-Heterocapsa_arctica.AAC.1
MVIAREGAGRRAGPKLTMMRRSCCKVGCFWLAHAGLSRCPKAARNGRRGTSWVAQRAGRVGNLE